MSAASKVGLIMGSQSDYPGNLDELLDTNPSLEVLWKEMKMAKAEYELALWGVPVDTHVVSAHRTPAEMEEYARTAEEKGTEVIIAGAGGSAHLAGMVAAHTALPVLASPMPTKKYAGVDSILSMGAMPTGIPNGMVPVNQANLAADFAVRALALRDASLRSRLRDLATPADNPSVGILTATPKEVHVLAAVEKLKEYKIAYTLYGNVNAAREEMCDLFIADDRQILLDLERLGKPTISIPTLSNGQDALASLQDLLAFQTEHQLSFANVSMGDGENAALFALEVLGIKYRELRDALRQQRGGMRQNVLTTHESQVQNSAAGVRAYVQQQKTHE